ncbi:Ig-like domain-containing protein [Bdellovibrio sp. HCB185ZH]|uniref:Ig-like domain-containing protein n=1 Tax=Bdellovibrio sp. HCB185ZH TaxID=3394235 RepID=UPI0039A46DB2
MKMPKYQLFGIIIVSAVSVVSFQNCSQANFSQAPVNAASSASDGADGTTNTPDSANYNGLKANDITLATNVGVTLSISNASIVAANSGTSLKVQSVGSPNLGTLTPKTNGYDFVSSVTGTASMTYTIVDGQNNIATAKITIKVVESSIATAPFYGCNTDGFLYSLDPQTGTVLKTVKMTYNGAKLECTDMVISNSGELYAKDNEESVGSNAYKVDATTGVATLYQRNLVTRGDRAVGLTLVDGKLITSEEHNPGSSTQTNSLIAIAADGVKTTVIPASAGYTMYGGDVKLLPDGYLYWTITNATSTLCRTAGAGGNQGILRIDPVSKATKEVACMDKKNIFGLGFASKGLYGFSEQGNLVRVDVNTGKTTLVKATGLVFIGAAANPILW